MAGVKGKSGGNRPGSGRKPGSMKERKTTWLHVRLTPSKAAILRRLADEHGGNRAKVIDGLIDGSATKSAVSVGDSFAAVRHYPGGEYEMLPVATVTEATPTLIVIALADGGSIRLAR